VSSCLCKSPFHACRPVIVMLSHPSYCIFFPLELLNLRLELLDVLACLQSWKAPPERRQRKFSQTCQEARRLRRRKRLQLTGKLMLLTSHTTYTHNYLVKVLCSIASEGEEGCVHLFLSGGYGRELHPQQIHSLVPLVLKF
jgi:hypothetical protein